MCVFCFFFFFWGGGCCVCCVFFFVCAVWFSIVFEKMFIMFSKSFFHVLQFLVLEDFSVRKNMFVLSLLFVLH